MALRFAIALLTGTFLGPASAAPIPRDTGKAELYFPTAVGAKWVLELNRNGQVREEFHEVLKVIEVHGARLVSVQIRDDAGNVLGEYQMEVSPAGLYRVQQPQPGTRIEFQTECLLKLPVDPKMPWTSDARSGGRRRSKQTHIASLPEEVKVPAGRFHAVRVVTETDSATEAGKTIASTRWYVPGKGMIRESSILGETVMKSFAAGKDP